MASSSESYGTHDMNAPTSPSERKLAEGHYWVRWGTNPAWDVMYWKDGLLWDNADCGYGLENFEVGPRIQPPPSTSPPQIEGPEVVAWMYPCDDEDFDITRSPVTAKNLAQILPIEALVRLSDHSAIVEGLEKERDDVLGRKDQATNNAKSQRFDDIIAMASGEVLEYIVAQEDMLDTVRAWAGHYRRIVEHNAAVTAKSEATILSLTKRLERAEEALRPFAAISDDYSAEEDDDFQVWRDFDVLGASLPLKHFRRARAALHPSETGEAK